MPKQPPTMRARIMSALYDGGATLEEIGKEYGISGERVRQLVCKVEPNQNKLSRVSPTGVMRAVRRPDVYGMRHVEKVAGVSVHSVERVLEALGLRDAAARLFRARLAKVRRLRHETAMALARSRVIRRLQSHTDSEGRPLPVENDSLTQTAIKLFGTIRTAREAAGFTGDYVDQSWRRGVRASHVEPLE